MIQAEIDQCIKTCNHHVLFRGFIPSRLLFVGDDGSSDSPPQPRLVSRGEVMASLSWVSSVSNVLRYAALSYCWGPEADAHKQCKTTRQSLAEHSTRGIDTSYLSPVVRDAATVTRQLGLSYLWVDSLCIVQDDERDWRDEAALMGLVYSNAHVTIVNLASDTCVKSFLEPWTATHKIWRAVRVPVDDTGLAKGNEGNISYNYSYEFLRDWQRSAWSKRGWTFQETKLSTRLVYFGASRIHFCCDGWLYTSGRSTRGKFERSIIDLAVDKQTLDPARELLNFWRWALVPQYSSKRFSVARDKLPAIGGIAKLVGDMTGFGYAAGLWTPHLHVDLVWYCRPLPGHSTLQALIQALVASDGEHAHDYIAPSWSW
ncbi:heterokaryon incompatibility protein-domain-containing protein, partial [Podospora aff. communis PSN243]